MSDDDNVTVKTCEKCKQVVLVMMVEPEERFTEFDPTPMRRYRILEVTPSHKIAVATDVIELHSVTCKSINRT